MKKHFNEDLYYPIAALLLGVVRLLPDSGTWWVIVELVVDLALLLMAALTVVVLQKQPEKPGKLKPIVLSLVGAAFIDYTVFAVLQLCGVETGLWNTVGAVCGLVLGAAALVLTIVYLLRKKSNAAH